MSGLKYVREKILHQSLRELAKQIGVSKQAVYSWESGRRNIPEKRIKQLSELSGVPEEVFLIENIVEDELNLQVGIINAVKLRKKLLEYFSLHHLDSEKVDEIMEYIFKGSEM